MDKVRTSRHFLAAEIALRGMPENRTTRARSCEALGHIIRRISETGYRDEDIADVRIDVEKIANDNRQLDNETFGDILRVLHNESTSFQKNANLVLSSGGAIAGAIVGLTNPQVGAALTIAGVSSEHLIPRAKNLFDNADRSILNLTSDNLLNAALRVSLAAAISKCDESDVFRGVVSDPQISTALAADILLSDQELVERAHSREKELVAACLKYQSSDPRSIDDELKPILQTVSRNIEELRLLSNDLIKHRNDEAERAEIYKRINDISTDIDNCTNIVRLSLRLITNDPKVIEVVDKSISAGKMVLNAVKACVAATSAVAFVGGIAGAALSLLSLFQNRPSEIESLKRYIKEQIDGLSKQIEGNFCEVFRGLEHIDAQLQLIQDALNSNHRETMAKLEEMSRELGAIRPYLHSLFLDSANLSIKTLLEESRSLIEATDSAAGYEEEKRKLTTSLYQHAIEGSRHSAYSGYGGGINITDVIRNMEIYEFKVERMFGLVEPILKLVGVADIPAAEKKFPDLMQWCIGTQCYLELALTPDRFPDRSFERRIGELWDDASHITSMLHLITGAEAIELARRAYVTSVLRSLSKHLGHYMNAIDVLVCPPDRRQKIFYDASVSDQKLFSTSSGVL